MDQQLLVFDLLWIAHPRLMGCSPTPSTNTSSENRTDHRSNVPDGRDSMEPCSSDGSWCPLFSPLGFSALKVNRIACFARNGISTWTSFYFVSNDCWPTDWMNQVRGVMNGEIFVAGLNKERRFSTRPKQVSLSHFHSWFSNDHRSKCFQRYRTFSTILLAEIFTTSVILPTLILETRYLSITSSIMFFLNGHLSDDWIWMGRKGRSVCCSAQCFYFLTKTIWQRFWSDEPVDEKCFPIGLFVFNAWGATIR